MSLQPAHLTISGPATRVATVLTLLACTTASDPVDLTGPPPPPPAGQPDVIPADWTQRAPIPESRYQPGVTVLDGIVYVAGGVEAGALGWTAQSRVLAYSAAEDTWSVAGVVPDPVRAPALAALGEEIYIVGGFRGDPWMPVTDVHIFDPVSGTTRAGPPLPFARGAVALVALDGRLHAIGGVSAEVDPVFGDWSSDHDVYDPATGVWTPRAPAPSTGRGAVVIDGRIYLIGWFGQRLDVYDPATDSWSRLLAPDIRWGTAVAAFAGKLYLIAGSEYQSGCCVGPAPVGTVDRFDPESHRWERVKDMPVGLDSPAAVDVDGALYVIAGSTYRMTLR